MDNNEMSFSSPTCNGTDKTNDDIDDQSLDYDNFNSNYYDPQSNQVLLYQRFKSSSTI
jgi:hypothetical protein